MSPWGEGSTHQASTDGPPFQVAFRRVRLRSGSLRSPALRRTRRTILRGWIYRKNVTPTRKFHIKDTTKGAEVWEVKRAPIYLKRDGLPTFPHWLIVARNALNPKEIKYFVSNAPAGTPLEVLLHVAFSRYHMERCFEEEKEELGMDHFEVRNYTSLKRHLLLTAVSHLFLAKVHRDWRGEKSAPDGLPAPPGGRGAGPFAVADRPSQDQLPGEGGRDHHPDPGAHRQVPTQPRQETHAAAA
jgi:hypothetical protein